jgi:hypothetical protein
LTQAEQQRHEAEGAQAAAAAERAQAEAARADAQATYQAAESSRKAAEAARTEAEAKATAAAAARNLVESIREHFWPAIFRAGGPLAEWREPLEAKAVHTDSAAPLLINSLQRYSLLRTAGDGQVPEELLQEIGVQAYRVWAEQGCDASRQAEFAERWAQAFRSELGTSYEFAIVRIGQPKDNTWMSYDYASGAKPVARVVTWYVKGPRSTLRAIVE